MPKKVLFVVNQLFQLMVAVQIRTTQFHEYDADLLLISGSSGMEDVYENIQKSPLFDKVNIVPMRVCEKETERIKIILKQIFDKSWGFYDGYGFKPSEEYDAVFLNAFTMRTCLMALYLNERRDVGIYRFEEGYGTYLDELGTSSKRFLFTVKLWDKALRMRKRPPLFDIIKGHYYFFPELILYKPKYKTFQIPPFDVHDVKFRDFIFSTYHMPPKDEFDKKYIFFEENIIDDDIDDYSLIMKIADVVGRENLMIKLHPRRAVDRFSEQGIKVSTSTGTPWEAILVQQDLSDRVLLTISSSAAMASRLYFNSNVKTFMLYKLFGKLNQNVQSPEQFLQYMERFQTIYDDGNFFVPENEDRFFEELSQC